MTPSELKMNVESAGHDPHFFERDTMRFFGDTMKNYGVRSAVIRTMYDASGNFTCHDGVSLEVWELYRKRPVKHGNQKSAYFDKSTFHRVFPAKG